MSAGRVAGGTIGLMKMLGILLLGTILLAPAGFSEDLAGFSAAAANAEQQWETKFRAIPDPANLRAYMQRLSARPHHVGSAYDHENAEWILSKFKEWGLDAHIETFDVLFPTPKERMLEMVAPQRFTAKLQEPSVPGDSTSSQRAEQLPSYNAYSIDGDVTGPLVYVNFGVPDDYEMLDRLGVSVKGAIVIARYGGSWRGIKPKVAAEHGAIGCLIYSDPHEDGYFVGPDFPAGPNRPKDGVQRGSVMDMPVYAGDPLTPGVGATKDAKRLPLSQAATLTKIPVLPISYADAQPLLAAMGGRVAPAAWRGSLPLTYRVGPGPARVHLKVSFNWDTKPIYDVIARIPGSGDPDEWIIRGNHHDAWVNGAEDPVSGTVALMEEARGLAALVKQGWKPRRTIVYCAWDGEEEGLLGSTEWAEEHDAELRQKAAVYINSDGNSRGFLRAGGSHTLERFINGVARDIQDPETRLSVWKRLQLSEIANQPASAPAAQRQELRRRPDLRIEALGSGSDYSPFLDHLGVASLNIGFGGEDHTAGVYHSVYDDFYWYTHFSDTDFVYGRALAETGGTAVMRLADSELLPYDFDDFTDTLRRYVDEVKKLAADLRDQIAERDRRIDKGVFTAVDDPREKMAPPPREALPPFLNFAPLENGWSALQRAATAYDQALAKAGANGGAALDRAALREANAKLIAVERALTLRDGLPNRPWYEHQIYAPGFYTGYGVKTLPAVRESIEQKQWKQADEQIARVGKVLENAGEVIQGAAAALSQADR
ncbi:MAG TPA: transferrin receptor-like dimerization domain-containing protein [Bryobacteraceae bacterium]|nr:transferrin receptor-like dimerization domain-containing protein [Bryobacteraceae bacterium]